MAAIALKPRILLPFSIASLFLFAILGFGVYHVESANISEEFGNDTHALRAVYETLLRAHGEKMRTDLKHLSGEAEIRAAFLAADPGRLLAAARPRFEHLRDDCNISLFSFYGASGASLLQVHAPHPSGPTTGSMTLREAMRTNAPASGIEFDATGALMFRVVLPWRTDAGLLGYIELGEGIDELLQELAESFQFGVRVLVDRQFLPQEAAAREGVDAEPAADQRVIFQSLPLNAEGQRRPSQGAALQGEGQWNVSSGYLPLHDAGQRQIGQILVLRDFSERTSRITTAVVRFTVISALVGLLLFGLFYAILGRVERQLAVWKRQLTEEGEARVALQQGYIAELERLALYDSLTGLPNRKLLQDHTAAAINRVRQVGGGFALCLVDLHRLREINDTLGHEAGDQVLQQVARRLRTEVPQASSCARTGGDEFALLLPDMRHDAALAMAQAVHDLLAQPLVIDGLALDIGASIGVVLFPGHGEDAIGLLRRADVALRHAKGTRKGTVIYGAELDPHNLRRLALFGELRKAIQQEGLHLHYQPQVDVASGRVVALEALARWQHPDHGVIAPSEFVPLAEQTGLIRSFSLWVMNEALRQCRLWCDQGWQLPVAVNLSPNNLMDATLMDQIAGLLERWQLPPHLLRLEITEGAFIAEPDRARAVLYRCREMGLGLSIDDYGTGYSSLSYLKELPAHELKIDGGFVGDMLASGSDQVIVSSTIALAHNLGLAVVAEGVEDQATWDALAAGGCDTVQGYFICRPLSPEALQRWLREQGSLAVAL